MGLKKYQSIGIPLRMSRWNLFSHFIQPLFCTLRITIGRYIIQKGGVFCFSWLPLKIVVSSMPIAEIIHLAAVGMLLEY
jgi:hypothetical protein